MGDRISFHLDENVNGAIALGLRRYGIDVTTSQEVGLSGQAYEAQLEFVQREHHVLFTQDSDFLIIASQSLDHPGIAYCRKDTQSIGEVIDRLVLIYEVLTPEEIRRNVEFLSGAIAQPCNS